MEKEVRWFKINPGQLTEFYNDNYGYVIDPLTIKPTVSKRYISIINIYEYSFYEIYNKIEFLCKELIEFNPKFEGNLYGVFYEDFEKVLSDKFEKYKVSMGLSYLRYDPIFVNDLLESGSMSPFPYKVQYDNF
jgi:hypothetical protein